jgi:hypothetical protein
VRELTLAQRMTLARRAYAQHAFPQQRIRRCAGTVKMACYRCGRMSLVILAVSLLLGAGGLAGWASDSHSPAPAMDPPTPTPAYRGYLPLVAHVTATGPVTLTLAVSPTAWQAESAGLDYAAVVQGTAWLVTYDQAVPVVGQNATAGDQMYRGNKALLFFDTSAIPAHATVLSATLTATNCWNDAGVPFTVEFYRTEAPLPPTPADWLNYGGPVVGELPSAQCGVWNAPLTSMVMVDPASIVKGGLTRYALVTDRLRQALAPAWGTGERLAFDCFADDALLVHYVIPSP